MDLIAKAFIFVIISTFLQGRNAGNETNAKKIRESSLLKSLWRRFDCRKNSDCPKSKYCVAWRCIIRHKGFCSNDNECSQNEWCNIQHFCVKKSWCDNTTDCGLQKCCTKIDPLAQGRCLPLTKPGQLCFIQTSLCPCLNGYHCKMFSKTLGRCIKDRDIKI